MRFKGCFRGRAAFFHEEVRGRGGEGEIGIKDKVSRKESPPGRGWGGFIDKKMPLFA
jgi:hypothetical protein